jgi:hypothetical protein
MLLMGAPVSLRGLLRGAADAEVTQVHLDGLTKVAGLVAQAVSAQQFESAHLRVIRPELDLIRKPLRSRHTLTCFSSVRIGA